MAVSAAPSWQTHGAAAVADAAEDRGRLPWPLACLLIGGVSVALWGLIGVAVSTLIV